MDREQDEAINHNDPEGSLLDAAWGVIANASDWMARQNVVGEAKLPMDAQKAQEWVEAAMRWRERYHEWLDNRHREEEG